MASKEKLVARPSMVCPLCGTKGSVFARPEKRKAGISGAKATGAVLTAGVSILATGLSRKQDVMAGWCHECYGEWTWTV